MTNYEKFMENKFAHNILLVMSAPTFHQGMTLFEGGLADPLMIMVSIIMMFVGLAFMWLPFLYFKEQRKHLGSQVEDLTYQRNEYRDMARSRGYRGNLGNRASGNTWIDDDDIDGDGRGGDTLRRMGVIE